MTLLYKGIFTFHVLIEGQQDGYKTVRYLIVFIIKVGSFYAVEHKF